MGLKDIMLLKKDSVESIFMKFSQLKNNKKEHLQNNIFCFYEGKDAQYYIPRIRLIDNNNCDIYDYHCGGKDKVLKINKIIKEKCKIDDCKILFFVDKDFNDNSNIESDIYITPYYAIENFYVKDNVIKDFLSAELQININGDENAKKDYLKALELFVQKRQKFIEDILLLNAWYSLQIKNGEGIEDKPDLKNIKEYKNLPADISLEVLMEKTINYIDIEENDIRLEMERISKNPLEIMRGKYFLEFLYEYLSYITSDKARVDGVLTKKRGISHTIGKNNLISLLSQYAETHNSLKIYLQYRLNVLEGNIAS
ncbi:DUF4435 domain-containing protein [Clostridium tertium]|uniref:DUF4435 domain-containing protein n=1 Tax=Clostridium tertium TaxID=1559 RepID=UPI0018AB15C1|nr:DUF4435 domain-containing protein [Clostridium tertium]MDB1969224.1 DUF4435 domain-containing protein [Clostridium tertium]